MNQFGGSHAPRDAIDWTLTEATIRGKLSALAEALAHERLALKPHRVVNRAAQTRAFGEPGMTVSRSLADLTGLR